MLNDNFLPVICLVIFYRCKINAFGKGGSVDGVGNFYFAQFLILALNVRHSS